MATLLGEIVWLFSQSPKHKNFFISDMEWLAMTPIVAPFGGHDVMIKDLKEHVFNDRAVAFLGLEDGKAVVKRM